MKLGLIALSGIRAHNPELTKLGLTLPGFVERSKVVASLPSLSLLTLAGMTPPEIEVGYVEVPHVDALEEAPADFDVVAISSYSAQIKEAYRLADHYRSCGTKVVMGGLHVSTAPEEALAHADSIVLGEGELSWPTVIEDLCEDRLEPVYDSRSKSFDLKDAPMPRYELLDPSRYNRLTVQTQRGCPYRCEFCAASVIISPSYKTKPVSKVIAEIRRIKELWPNPFIEFADDNSFVNKNHSKLMLLELVKENVRWFTETDVSVAEDEELLALMADSGCREVLIGFESPSYRPLDGVEKSSNWKARQLDHYVEAIHRIQGHGIAVNGCFILGLDRTGPESFEDVFDFARSTGLYDVQITLQTPFPGTYLYERLKRDGRLLREGAWELCTLFDVNFVPTDMTVSELETGFRNLAERLYSEQSTAERRETFKRQLHQGRQSSLEPEEKL